LSRDYVYSYDSEVPSTYDNIRVPSTYDNIRVPSTYDNIRVVGEVPSTYDNVCLRGCPVWVGDVASWWGGEPAIVIVVVGGMFWVVMDLFVAGALYCASSHTILSSSSTPGVGPFSSEEHCVGVHDGEGEALAYK
jgi:hypothetical protein